MNVTIYHKGVSPISAATIWALDGDYLPVEWTVLLVSLLSAAAFVIAMRLAPNRKCVGRPSPDAVMSNRCGRMANGDAVIGKHHLLDEPSCDALTVLNIERGGTVTQTPQERR